MASPPAYLVGTMTVHNPTIYKQYVVQTTAHVARYGGRFLTRGGEVTTLEGEKFTQRMVIIEFPSRAVLNEWYNDPDCVATAKLRQESAVARVVVQEGWVNWEADAGGVGL